MSYDYEVTVKFDPDSWFRKWWYKVAVEDKTGSTGYRRCLTEHGSYGNAWKYARTEKKAEKRARKAVERHKKKMAEYEIAAQKERKFHITEPEAVSGSLEKITAPVGKIKYTHLEVQVDALDDDGASYHRPSKTPVVARPGAGNAFASLLKWTPRDVQKEELHAPIFDLDLPCQLIPSRTEGHYHLYIDKAMPWEDYLKLLNVMVEVGIVEDLWVQSAKRDKMAILRKPPVDYQFEMIRKRLRDKTG